MPIPFTEIPHKYKAHALPVTTYKGCICVKKGAGTRDSLRQIGGHCDKKGVEEVPRSGAVPAARRGGFGGGCVRHPFGFSGLAGFGGGVGGFSPAGSALRFSGSAGRVRRLGCGGCGVLPAFGSAAGESTERGARRAGETQRHATAHREERRSGGARRRGGR